MLTPVELLPGVTGSTLGEIPPDDIHFGEGTRRRVSLLLGLPLV